MKRDCSPLNGTFHFRGEEGMYCQLLLVQAGGEQQKGLTKKASPTGKISKLVLPV
ncbi:hypothetical protein [Chitinophaga defluvii]|uniref:Peptidase C30 domain-containing protein n=1 Tax=Chitinophaga defluvii TaxID=3163343 RepID=A0ABV2SZE7_9BACT